MMRTFALLAVIPAMTTTSHCQNLFVEAHGDLLFPLGGDPYASNYARSSTDGGTTAYHKSVLTNYGKGAGGGLVLGGSFAAHLGWEVRGSYVAGRKTTLKSSSSGGGGNADQVIDLYGRYALIQPAIRIRSGDLHQWYACFGPSMLIAPKVHEEYTMDASLPGGGGTHGEEEADYSGGWGWGAFGALGFAHQGSGHIGYFMELGATAIAWAPDRYEITSLVVDGVDRLNELSTRDRITEFVDEYTETLNTTPDPGEPNKEVRTWLPMSTWGVRAGIRMTIGRQQRHEMELRDEQFPAQ